MTQSLFVINAILPILFILATGYLIRRKHIFSDIAVENLKKLVVNITLPAVMFTSFLKTKLETRYLLLMFLVFFLCLFLYYFGKWTQKIFQQKWQYFPFLMTGFEFGMLGLSLFGTAYGLENFGSMAILGIPHEFFIWFVYVTLLMKQGNKTPSAKDLLKSFISSPVIIAIFLSVSINLLGWASALQNFSLSDGIFSFLNILANLTGPIILLLIGYEIHINRNNLKSSLLVVGLRLGTLIPVALLLNHFFLSAALGLGKNFQAAFFTLLILPPPFIIPIFMKENLTREKAFINNTLMLHTVASISAFIIYFAINPTL